MQNRTAVILSLGMLLEDVNTNGFIVKLLQKAKEENAEFAFTPELQKQAFQLSEHFNLGKVESQTFEVQLLQLLGINKMQSEVFWAEWNAMLKVGNVIENIKLLQEMGREHNALTYLSSDTNSVHLKKIAEECEGQNIIVELQKQPMLFGLIPLYASCQIGKNGDELTKHIVNEVKSKEFNKPNEVTMILGNPDNIQNENHKAVVKKKCEAIINWCQENNVSVKLHNHSLKETLTQIFISENSETNELRFAV